jgi:hypothetical protein
MEKERDGAREWGHRKKAVRMMRTTFMWGRKAKVQEQDWRTSWRKERPKFFPQAATALSKEERRGRVAVSTWRLKRHPTDSERPVSLAGGNDRKVNMLLTNQYIPLSRMKSKEGIFTVKKQETKWSKITIEANLRRRNLM